MLMHTSEAAGAYMAAWAAIFARLRIAHLTCRHFGLACICKYIVTSALLSLAVVWSAVAALGS